MAAIKSGEPKIRSAVGYLSYEVSFLALRFVTPEEIEREKRDLRDLRRTFDTALRRQWQVNRNRERWVRRVEQLELEFRHLRDVGWFYLRAAERRYWRRLEERLIPEARESLEYWTKETDRHFKEVIVPLRERIRKLEEEIKRKVLPALYRVKIRLYAVKEYKKYYLTFQGFFDVDTILDPETGLPVWTWWLTKMEIEYARYHFHGYWKGGVKKPKPFKIDEIRQAYLTETGGISLREHLEETPGFKYTKNVPEEYQRLAGRMTLEEIIIGISNIKPRPVPLPEGVFFEYAMIIDEEGDIKWMDKRDRWVWKPTAEIIDRVRKELGLR